MPAAGDVVNAPDTAVRLATLAISANSSTYTTTETTVATVSASVVSGQVYKVTAYLCVGSDAAGTEVSSMRLREDNSTGTQFSQGNVSIPTALSTGYAVTMIGEYTATSTASKTWVVTGQRANGSGNHGLKAATVRPCLVTVDLIVS